MTLLMIRPVRFGYNAQTAVNNAFQEKGTQDDVQQKALAEFDGFVAKLREKDIDVLVVEDTPEPHTPDSIFPNNWISTHQNGAVVLYPMFAENRRLERKDTVLDTIRKHFVISNLIDYTDYEAQGRFLESTGSFILDRIHRIAYACISPRTDKALFLRFCDEQECTPVIFESYDEGGTAVYHTNVMMTICDRYAVINLESIPAKDRELVVESLEGTGKAIITITHKQMNHFAGNMLQVANKNGEKYLVMSSQAYNSLTDDQVQQLTAFNPIIHSKLDTIETNGGGSARCMMAEIYLPGLS